MPYSLLLFDYDGTLCDTRRAITYSLRRTLIKVGHAAPTEEALQAIVERGVPLAETLHQLLPPGSPPVPTAWVQTYRSIYLAEAEPLVTPFPGARETLAAATAAGAQVVVISNKGLAVLENSLRRHELYDYTALVLGDERATAAGPTLPLKPDPALYTQRIQPRFPASSPAHTLVIGDTATDLQFARNCGLAAAWAKYGFGAAAACELFRPAYQIDALAELLPLFGSGREAPVPVIKREW
jgi:phosphoglycolate phosphatase